MAPYARAAGVVGAALAGCRDGGPEARMAVRRVGDAAEAEPEAEAEGVSAVAPGVRLGAQRGGGERGEQRGEAGAERGGVAVADAGGAQPISGAKQPPPPPWSEPPVPDPPVGTRRRRSTTNGTVAAGSAMAGCLGARRADPFAPPGDGGRWLWGFSSWRGREGEMGEL